MFLSQTVSLFSNLRNRNLTAMKNSYATPVKRSSVRIRGKKPFSLRSIARKSCQCRTVIDLTDENEVKEYIERVHVIVYAINVIT